jgi:phage gpG-like protein
MKVVLKENISEVIKSLNEGKEEIQKNLQVQMFQALSILEAAIKQNIRIRSGLKVHSGSLLNSIQKEVRRNGDLVEGRIGPENIPYAAIHEYGGTIPARRIEPRHGKALRWMGSSGGFFFSKGHEIPATNIKARPYLQPAIDEKGEEIRQNFALFLTRILEKS